ncbi:protein of unknown function [Quadrisphaera granulorum]|uniref:Uncharacterized protein DUF4262 n=1 Tax=Quadrisphaera granulorum TaxID=317664 RepID=A0A316AE15_9ACTN|nr:DUF4262 domain-containing protein [Quadrisphaera granulorum]PWJ55861.1 uncharacterized protein DUF4262 [Quadrisphaera granulorum]SZE95358.1 protein of unknown function [Quadrisphaera granulorum]
MCDVCNGEPLEQVLARYQRMVDEYGWAVMGVEADGPRRPGFAYTVGLWAKHGHPELLISGCPVHSGSVDVLNDLAQHVAEGLRLDRGEAVPECIEERVVTVDVADVRRLEIAQALEGNDDVLIPALQLVRPDPRGRWPWEPGWSEPGVEYFGRPLPRPRSSSPRGGRVGQRHQPRRHGRR